MIGFGQCHQFWVRGGVSDPPKIFSSNLPLGKQLFLHPNDPI